MWTRSLFVFTHNVFWSYLASSSIYLIPAVNSHTIVLSTRCLDVTSIPFVLHDLLHISATYLHGWMHENDSTTANVIELCMYKQLCLWRAGNARRNAVTYKRAMVERKV